MGMSEKQPLPIATGFDLGSCILDLLSVVTAPRNDFQCFKDRPSGM